MAALAALDLPAGPAFVDWLRTVWDRGDAAFPLDPRLPAPIRAATLATMRPATVIGPDGERPWTDGEPEPVADGDGLVVATSGSTGTPKGVVLTHAAIAAHARAVHERLSVDPARDRWLACLPLAHMGGLGVVLRAVVDGVGLDVVDGPDPATVAAAPVRARLDPHVARADRHSTGPMRPPTGGSCSAARPTRPGDRPTSCGPTGSPSPGGGVVYRPGGPLTGIEVRVVDGEVQLRGPTLLRAYRDGTDPPDRRRVAPHRRSRRADR